MSRDDRADDILISLSAQSGDPNLVVNLVAEDSFPVLEAADLSSRVTGSDALRITSTERVLRNPECASKSCPLHVGVVCATEQCSWTIKAAPDNELFHVLLDSVPNNGIIKEGQTRYYYQEVQDEENFYIQAHAISGSVDVDVEVIDLEGKPSSWT